MNILINGISRSIKLSYYNLNFNKQVYKYLVNVSYNNNYSCKFLKHYIKFLLKTQYGLEACPRTTAVVRIC